MPPKADHLPAGVLALYEKLVATNPSIEVKGATMPYTSLNGNMFSFLTKKGQLALRLPEEERDAFLNKFNTKLCVQHGRVMKEYVVVPDQLLRATRNLRLYFDLSVQYVESLQSKSTKRPPKKPAAIKKKPANKKRGAKKTKTASPAARKKNKAKSKKVAKSTKTVTKGRSVKKKPVKKKSAKKLTKKAPAKKKVAKKPVKKKVATKKVTKKATKKKAAKKPAKSRKR